MSEELELPHKEGPALLVTEELPLTVASMALRDELGDALKEDVEDGGAETLP